MGPRSSQLNLLILLLPAFIGGVAVYLSPNIKSQTDLFFVIMYTVGFLMFLYAKYKVIKTGRYFSFGFASMQLKDKIIYVIGYLLMIFGFFFIFFYELLVKISSNCYALIS